MFQKKWSEHLEEVTEDVVRQIGQISMKMDLPSGNGLRKIIGE